MLAKITPGGTTQEQRLPVHPLATIAVIRARGRSDREIHDRRTTARGTQLRVAGQVTDQRYRRLPAHLASPRYDTHVS